MHINNSDGENVARQTWLRSPYILWSFWLVWLPFLVPMLIGLFLRHLPMLDLLLSLAGLMVFLGTYLWGTWQTVQQRLLAQASPRKDQLVLAWLQLALLSTLSCVLVLNFGPNWNGLFFFTCAYASGRFPFIPATAVAVILALLNGATSRLGGANWLDLVSPTLLIVIINFAVILQGQWIRTRQQLEIAREEIAHFAALEERLRIARDLHDLLGHTLSLITLKSELAGHLLEANAERSALASEIRDIEQVARTTLQEVREMVAGYRTPSLMRELREAQAILTSAQISYRFEDPMNLVQRLPAETTAILAWVVREGVTNVVRHSQAQWCRIRIQQTGHAIQMEMLNSGSGRSETTASRPTSPIERSDSERSGQGLRGLSERLAAVGGRCEAQACQDGGFCLIVSVPLSQEDAEERNFDMMATQTLERKTDKS